MSKRKLTPMEKRKLLDAVWHLGKLGDEINDFVRDGEKVRLDVEKITQRKDYAGLQESYRNFVELNAGAVFTARSYRPKEDGFSAMMELEEDPTWLFWYKDLIRVEGGNDIG